MKTKIISILSTVKKDGIDNFLKYLENSSFFTDPASSQGHNSYEGGLADHSFLMYNTLVKFSKDLPDYEKYSDSLKIIGLLHDISLMGTFQKNFKNVPLKDTNGKNKKDDRGKIVFVEKELYENYYQNTYPYPMGQLSTIILKKYLKLTLLEDLAIFWNQNFINDFNLINRAQKTSKIILYTYFADIEARLYSGQNEE